ncbi:MAG: ankyrin repeat domain-containing protein [Proteobacteria bacterium]|nr:ankyrin repeat domain-containing protein [Pseudomonadota bacterium]
MADAASKDDLAQVETLLADGAPPDDRGTKDATALMLAAEHGYVDVIKVLLAAGADPRATRTGAITALHHAAAGGSVEAVMLLIQAKADIDAATTATGQTPLLSALISKRWNVARALLTAGAKLTATPLGERALLLALDDSYLKLSALSEDTPYIDTNLAGDLIQRGARIDLKDSRGDSLLHLAAHARQPEMVSFLLKRGLKVNEQNIIGDTPLKLATDSSSLELLVTGMATLMSMPFGSGPGNRPDFRTTMKILASRGFPSPGAGELAPRLEEIHLRRKRTLEILLASGADPNPSNKEGDTPLTDLAVNGDSPSVEILLVAGANSNVVRVHGYSPLMRAAAEGNADVVKALLAHGAQVDLRNEIGETALMSGAKGGGDRDTVAALLAAHPDVNARNNDGQTALMYAVGARKVDITEGDYNADLEDVVSELLAAGADPSIQDKDGNTALSLAKSPKYQTALPLLRKATSH